MNISVGTYSVLYIKKGKGKRVKSNISNPMCLAIRGRAICLGPENFVSGVWHVRSAVSVHVCTVSLYCMYIAGAS